MGYYINPPDMEKEAFLRQKGRLLTDKEVRNFPFGEGEFPVCLVDNGAFTAAGIAYDLLERDSFLREDGRPKQWFACKARDLDPFLPEHLKAA